MPFIDIDDTTLFYRDRGHGPLTVFLHAFMLDHSMWLDQFNALSNERRCVIIDQRGFGRSDPIAAEFLDPGRYADDVALLIRALGATRADVVGFSMGGTIALHLWRRHASLVNSLALLSTGIPGAAPPPRTPPPATGRGSARYLEDNADKAVLQGKDVLFRQFDYHYGKEPSLFHKARYRSMFEGTRYEMMVASFLTMKAAPRLDLDLSTIDIPVLLAWGAEEQMLPSAENRDAILAKFQDAEVALIPRAGRFMSWENPQGTSDALRGFWQRVQTKREGTRGAQAMP